MAFFTVNAADVPLGWSVQCGFTTNVTLGEAWQSDVNAFWAASNSSVGCTSLDCQADQTVLLVTNHWTQVSAWTPVYRGVYFDWTNLYYTGVAGSVTYMCAKRSSPIQVCDNNAFPARYVTATFGCYPAAAPVRRLNVATGLLEQTTVGALSLGDAIECVRPPPYQQANLSAWEYGTCITYYTQNVQQPSNGALNQYTVFIELQYQLANGSSAVAKATPQHYIFVAYVPISSSSPSSTAPVGSSMAMAMVKPGALVTVYDEALGGFYTTPVLSVSTHVESGAFSPFLFDGGLPIIDGVVYYAFSTIPAYASKVPGALINEFFYDAFAPVWQAAKASIDLGCLHTPAGLPRDETLCPCLDGNNPCVRMGAPLASLQDGLPTYANAHRTQALAFRSMNKFIDFAGFVANVSSALQDGATYSMAGMLAVEDAFAYTVTGH